ncbi:MAG TPA: gephyrin-like molybdotransferase Glp [Gemmatimonadaceae bacterium]|nr:gephyrin-like molybdotransferase Glp [Gemmatimonadaceae bacterium]
MLSVADAAARIIADIRTLGAERVALLDSLGRVLAEPVRSPLTLPAWDNSAMDGYAVRSDDVRDARPDAPVTLRVLETVAAGAFPSRRVEHGTATRIMTGAPMPEGADSVVRVEDTDRGTAHVAIHDARDAGRNVRRRAEDIEAGSTVFDRGQPIGPAQVGVLASIGAAVVDVYRRPRVAFFGSGDEIVDLDGLPDAVAGRKILTSNTYTLHAMIRAAGGEPINLGLVRDDPGELRDRIARSAGADLLITSAGISAGEFDYVRSVLTELGVEMTVWKVRMRPGAPLGFGWLGTRPWVGLPGNPVSTMVTFDLFVRPMLRRMLGHTRLYRRPIPVTLEEPVAIAAPLTHFMRGIVSVGAGGAMTARLTGPQGSGVLTSMARANALLVIPEDRPRVEAGETVNALLLGEDAHMSATFAL